jgi:hypothetical protein
MAPDFARRNVLRRMVLGASSPRVTLAKSSLVPEVVARLCRGVRAVCRRSREDWLLPAMPSRAMDVLGSSDDGRFACLLRRVGRLQEDRRDVRPEGRARG